MLKQYSFIRLVAALSFGLLLTLVAGCSKQAGQGFGATAPAASSQSAAARETGTASKLGDLAAFRRIAIDVATIVDKGDLPAAKARIKDLEVAWDSAEAGLKPRAADDWHVLDKAIDRALAALRADAPTQADCKAALADVLKTFDTFEGKV